MTETLPPLTARDTFTLDGEAIPFAPGQTVLEAALAANRYIPHLCWHPEMKTHGSCRLCVVEVGGRLHASCALPAQAGLVVTSQSALLHRVRRTLLELLFAEGNHFCPGCEKSGDCLLQALAYAHGMTASHFDPFYPQRKVDASHPAVWLDPNRCILCGLCVRASLKEKKEALVIGGRGIRSQLRATSLSERLADTPLSETDHAARICPVGALNFKEVGFATPIGQRRFDHRPPALMSERERYR
ncbi:hypothetical protein JCM16106_19750 [Hydrogenophilus islandicus]